MLSRTPRPDVMMTTRDTILRGVAILRLLYPHPNMVHLEEVFEDRDYFYLVFELCSGGELFDHVVKKVGAQNYSKFTESSF